MTRTPGRVGVHREHVEAKGGRKRDLRVPERRIAGKSRRGDARVQGSRSYEPCSGTRTAVQPRTRRACCIQGVPEQPCSPTPCAPESCWAAQMDLC